MSIIKAISFKQIILMAVVTFIVSGCGFRLQQSYSIPAQLNTLHLSSNDEYSELTRILNDRLRISSVKLVEASSNIPTLRLVNDSLERATLSLYPTGNVAEYELIYHVNYTVTLPNEDPQHFKTAIRRDYKDDPRTALAKSREMELLVKEMRSQAADRIVQTLATIGKS